MKFMKAFPTKVLMTAILAAASHATHASGADKQSGISVTVRYDDLNLSAPAGVASLKGRISRAAAQVCAERSRSDPFGTLLRQRCMRRATEEALAQVQWPAK